MGDRVIRINKHKSARWLMLAPALVVALLAGVFYYANVVNAANSAFLTGGAPINGKYYTSLDGVVLNAGQTDLADGARQCISKNGAVVFAPGAWGGNVTWSVSDTARGGISSEGAYTLGIGYATGTDSYTSCQPTDTQYGTLELVYDNTAPVFNDGKVQIVAAKHVNNPVSQDGIVYPIDAYNNETASDGQLGGTIQIAIKQTEANPALISTQIYDVNRGVFVTGDMANAKFSRVNEATWTIDSTTLPDGKYLFKVASKDMVNKVAYHQFYMNINNNTPTVSISVNGTDAQAVPAADGKARDGSELPIVYAKPGAVLSFSAEDSFGIGVSQVFVNGMPQASFSDITLSDVDRYEVIAKAWDTTGQESYEFGAVVIIDNTRPVISELVTPIDCDTVYTIKATDDHALARITGNIYDANNSQLLKSNSKLVSGTAGEFSFDVSTFGLAEGEYTIRYNAADAAGNIAATGTQAFIIDTTAPVISLVTGSQQVPLNDNLIAPSTNVRVKPESASDTIYVEKDNVVVWSGQWSGTGGYPSLNWIFSQKGDGEYVFYLCDSHCNQSSKITLEVDGTKPTIQDITITENPTSENSIVVSGTIFDEHFNSYKCRIYSGDKIVNLSNSIGEWPGGTANVADGELCVMNIGVLLDGDYYVRVYADDTVGNNNNDGSLYFPFTIARATTPSIPTTPVTPVVPTNPSTPAASATPASSPVVAASTASYSSVVGGTNYAGTTTGDETNDDSEVASTTATSPSNPLQDTGEILGAQDRQDWSLINLILTVATVVVGVAAAIAHFVRRRGEESNRSVAVVIGGLAAVGAAIAFFLTENTALPVVWFDQWTLLMVGLALVSVITTAVALRKSSGK